MNSYQLSTAADIDLAAIFWDGIERFGSAQTERYLEKLEALFAHIAEFPRSARLRTELTPPVRVYPTDAHMIIYQIEDGGVVILRIRSARENWIAAPLEDDQP